MSLDSAVNETTNILAKEPVGRLILRFAVPSMIGLLVNALYNIVDQIYIGNGIGYLGIAAANIAFPLTTLSTAAALLFGVGGASSFSLRMGRGEAEKANLLAGNGMFCLVATGLALGIGTLVFLKPLLVLLGATNEVMPLAIVYTGIIALGLPFLTFTHGACTYIRTDGNPAYSMGCQLIGATFNIIFDPIFLFGFHMGIAGIALATLLSQILTTLITGHYLLKKRKLLAFTRYDLRPQKQCVLPIVTMGFGICINQVAIAAVQLVLNNVMRYYGAISPYGSEIPLAAAGVISIINALYMALVIGIVQGFQPILGYNYGAKLYGRVKQIYTISLLLATVLSVVTFLICQIFPRQIVGLFGSGNEAYFRFTIHYLRIIMLVSFANGIHPIVYNIFNSIGKTGYGMLISISRQMLFFLPLLLILPVFYGLNGALYASPIADGVAAILSLALFSGELREIKKMVLNECAISR